MAENMFSRFRQQPEATNPFAQFTRPRRPQQAATQPDDSQRDRTWGEVAKDTGLGIAQGAVNLVGGAASLVEQAQPINQLLRIGAEAGIGPGPSSVASDLTGRVSEAIEDKLSAPLRRKRQELAQTEGFLPSAKKVLTDPALAGQFLAEQVPNLATLGFGSAATAARAGSAALARGATREVAEQAGQKAARRFLTRGGTAMESGFANVQAVNEALAQPDEVWDANPQFQELLARGLSRDAAKRTLASRQGALAAAVSAPLSYLGARVSAPFEAEVFTRAARPGGLRGLASGAGVRRLARGAAAEAAEEAVQEGGSQFAVNVAGRQLDPSRGLLEGVPEAAGTGAAIGGLLGGGLAAGGTIFARRSQQPPSDRGAEPAPAARPPAPQPVQTGSTIEVDLPPAVPPWVDLNTGEMRVPTHDEVKAHLRGLIEQQVAAGRGPNIKLTRATSEAWGVPVERLRALRKEVLEDRRWSERAQQDLRRRADEAAAAATSQFSAPAAAGAVERTDDDGERSGPAVVDRVGNRGVAPAASLAGADVGRGAGGEAEGVSSPAAVPAPSEQAAVPADAPPGAAPDPAQVAQAFEDDPAQALSQLSDGQVLAVARAVGVPLSPRARPKAVEASARFLRAGLSDGNPERRQAVLQAIQQVLAGPPVPEQRRNTKSALAASRTLRAGPGQVVAVEGQGADLAPGRYRVGTIGSRGEVSLTPVAGGEPVALSLAQLRKEIAAGVRFSPAQDREGDNETDVGLRGAEASAPARAGRSAGSEADAGGPPGAGGGPAAAPGAAGAADLSTGAGSADPDAALSGERRHNLAERARIDAMPQDERDAEIARLRARVDELEGQQRINRVTGMRGQQAFEEDAALGWPVVAAFDLDGFKAINDTVGHSNGDAILRAVARELEALDSDSVRFYHRSGDEFAARFRDPAEAEEIMANLQEDLERVTVLLTVAVAGQPPQAYEYQGIGMSYGLGADYDQADLSANQQKLDRLAAGLRDDPRAPGSNGAARRLRPLPRDTEGGQGDRAGAVAQPEEVGDGRRASDAAAGPGTDADALTATQAGASEGGEVTMQNRDRSRLASIQQMQEIRRGPDPDRLGFSRDPNTGAPMVAEGRPVPEADKGVEDVVVMASGRRVPVRYAVVEADELAASHNADGVPNPAYETAPLKALNNGRTAGLQAAWAAGNADAYRAGIERDTALHGVSREAIQAKRQPVLVRLYDPTMNTGDMGAESNLAQQLGLSPVEQAQTDARALPDLSAITWAEDGSIQPAANANFFRAWFQNLGATQAATMQDAQGRPNAEALRRVRAAITWRAYGDERLLTALVEDTNPDNRNVMNALVQAAPAFARLESDNQVAQAIRDALIGGLDLLRDAAGRGLRLDEAIAQRDMFGRNPDADAAAMFMASNIRSPKRMAEAFRAAAEYASRAELQAATLDLLGGAPEPTSAEALAQAGMTETDDARISRDEGAEVRGREGEPGEPASRRAAPGDAQASRVAEEQADLFGRPSRREEVEALRRRRDEERSGRTGTGRTDMMAGPGELFAGPRPEQLDIESGTLPEHDIADYGKARALPEHERLADAQANRVEAGRRTSSVQQLDLFVATRGQRRPDQGHPSAVRIDKTRLRQASRLVRTGQFRSGIDRVGSLADAAHILAPLRKSPQERFLILALDADSRPLAVIQHTVGGPSEAAVYPAIVLGAVASVPGVKSVVFAHNHPSGRIVPSAADRALDRRLADLFRGSGIAVRGAIIVGPGTSRYSAYGEEFGEGRITPARRREEVPIVERAFRRLHRPDEVNAINGPEQAIAHAKRERAESPAGILLLDGGHQVIGSIPINPKMVATLRTGNPATSQARLMAVATEAAAHSVIIYGNERDKEALFNVGSALSAGDLRVLDVIVFDGDKGKSTAYEGTMRVGHTFLSRPDDGDQTSAPLGGASRTAWGEFPPAIVAYPFATGQAKIRDHADYKAAKGGDNGAAWRLVRAFVTPDAVARIRAMVGDRRPVLVPVLAEEQVGRNRIPMAFAMFLGEAMGLPVSTSIVQSFRVHHTGAGAFHRLAFQPAFDGPVEPRDYLIVDDAVTLGGTLANLRGHIESSGGRVIGAAVLTGSGAGVRISLDPATERHLRETFGDGLEQYLREELGFGIAQLTEGEAAHIRKARTLDEVRDRVAQARLRESAGRDEGTLRSQSAASRVPEGRPQGLTDERARAILAELTADWGDNAPEVRLATTPAEWTRALRSAGLEPSLDLMRAEGLYDGRPVVWLNLQAIRNENRLAQVLAHEALGHYGVENVVGAEQWRQIVDSIDRMRVSGRGSEKIRQVLAEVSRRYVNIPGGLDLSTAEGKTVFAKEAIAVMAERGIRTSAVMRVVAAVRRWLRRFMPGLGWSESDILGLLGQADSFLRAGRAGESAAAGAAAASRRSPVFYSALLESVTRAAGAPKKGGAAAWKSWLDGAQRRGEFRQSEREWLGVDEWLASRDTTTREELADFIRANQVQVEEVVLDERGTELPQGWSVEPPIDENGNVLDYGDWVVIDEAGVARGAGSTRERAIADAQDEHYRAPKMPKFAEYQLPGGDNYRELLLTLPTQDAAKLEEANRLHQLMGVAGTPGAERARLMAERDRLRAEAGNPQTFRSSHFDQPNILAHVRFNERTDADGKRVLFIEEIQSDWHQAGRKRGYASNDKTARDEFDAYSRELAAKYGLDPAQNLVMYASIKGMDPAEVSRYVELQRRAIAAGLGGHVVPDAPFKATDEWAMLAFKRMARWAVDNGFDRIAWTTGEQQAERYDLSKRVDKVSWTRANASDGKKLVVLQPKGHDTIEFRVTPAGKVETIGGTHVEAERFAGKGLDEVVGKDIAERILADEKDGSLEGAGLKVGGEGMRTFYDKILPAAVGKWAKKFGARAGKTRIVTGEWTVDGEDVAAAEEANSLDITDAMRDAVLAGQPLFSRQPPAELLADIEVAMGADIGRSMQARAKAWLEALKPENLKDNLRSVWLGALGTNHLTELGQDYLPGMRHYSDILKEMEEDRNTLMQEGEQIAERVRSWAGKNRAMARRLFGLMHEATIDGVDPSKAYEPLRFRYGGKILDATDKNVREAIKAIRQQMRERSGDTKQDMLNRIKALTAMARAEKRRRGQYGGLVAKWNELSQEAQEHFIALRDAYASRSEAIEEALAQRIEDLKSDGVPDGHRRAMVAKIREQFETARLQGIYFPLQRFGQFFVAAEKDDTTTFLRFESIQAADKAEKELKARGWRVTAKGKLAEAKAEQAPPGTFVAEVIAELRKANISEKTQDSIYQLYLNALPELSMRKHQIHRKAIPGFDPDALRAFGWNMLHGSHQLAKLRHMHKLEGVLKLMDKQREEMARDPNVGARKAAAAAAILEELNRRHQWIATPTDSRLTALASSIGFTYYLGLTPAAALVNLTQVPIVAYPVLGAKFGAAKAANALLKASAEAFRTVGDIERVLGTDEERRAFQAIRASGVLERTQAHNLAGIAEGGLSSYNPAWAKAMEVIGFGFHKAEVINRESVAMAAFRLARESGMSFDEAVRYARDAVVESNFDYCVDTETEALTTDGWKSFDQIRVGDIALAVDAEGRAVESPVLAVNLFPGQKDVIEFTSSRRFSMALTPHHDVVIQRHDSNRGWGPVTKVQAQDLKDSHHVLRAPLAPIERRSGLYGRDFAALLGWIAAEGWYAKFRGGKGKCGVRLAQSATHNPGYVEEIRGLLSRLAPIHSEQKPAPNGTITWTIGGDLRKRILREMPDKLLTFDMFKSMTAEEMEAVLDAFAKGDGHLRGNTGACTIAQAAHNRQNLQVLQAMAAVLGRAATLDQGGDTLIITGPSSRRAGKRTIARGLARERKIVDGVWCPTTQHGTWIARRRGAVFVTGNSNANRARFMQSGAAKVLLMFRQYSLNMTWFLARNLWLSTKGMDPQVRREARKKLTGVLGMTALFSGVLGLPLMSVLFGVLESAAATFGDDDEPFDAEAEFRNFLADMFGPQMANVLATGPVNAMTGADIASRVSLSQLWFRDADRELEGRGMFYHLLEQAAGPMGGILKNALVGKQQIDEGHLWRGVETMLPKALKDGMKSARYAVEGVNNLRGDPLVQDLSLWQTLLQLSGFTPDQVARQYDANRAIKGYEQAILDRRQHLIGAYYLAYRLGDADGLAAARAKIAAFNAKHPEIAITGQTLRRSMIARMRYSQRAESGIVVNPRLEAKARASARFAEGG